MVENVVDLERSFQLVTAEGEVAAERQVAGVPGLGMVLRDVGHRLIAFARVYETLVQMPAAIIDARHSLRPAWPDRASHPQIRPEMRTAAEINARHPHQTPILRMARHFPYPVRP